jgi:hypothetical protein
MDGIEQVVVDVPCMGCGYNLRSQDAEGRCPECGSRVRWTLEETALLWGPAYLRQFAAQVRWVAVTAIAIPVVPAAGILFLIGLERLQFPVFEWGAFLMVVIPFYMAVVFHVGAVWQTGDAQDGIPLKGHGVGVRLGALMFAGATIMPWMAMIPAFSGGSIRGMQLIWQGLILGLAIYPVLGAELLMEAARRGGRRTLGGLLPGGVWLFGAGVVLLDVALFFAVDPLGGRAHAARVGEKLILALAYGGGGMTLLGLIGSCIALFQFSLWMRELARDTPVAGTPLTQLVSGEVAVSTHDDSEIGNPWLK